MAAWKMKRQWSGDAITLNTRLLPGLEAYRGAFDAVVTAHLVGIFQVRPGDAFWAADYPGENHPALIAANRADGAAVALHTGTGPTFE